MSRRVGRSKSTLAEAVGGRHLPRWDTVVDFVRACEGDPAEWRSRWERARSALADAVVAVPVDLPAPVDPDAGTETDPDGAPAVSAACEDEPEAASGPPPQHEPEPVPVACTQPVAVDPEPTLPVTARSTTSPAPERAPVRALPRPLILLAAVVVLCALVGMAGFVLGRAEAQAVPGPAVRAIEVQNKVALGPDRLVEDRTPVYLSAIPIAYCAAADRMCKVPGTEMQSGAGLVAHCTVRGQELHNYNVGEAAARPNPDRSDSDLWYRASFPDGRVGYISEVYLTSSSRGGLGLPQCAPGVASNQAGGPQG